jgi:hypothetical protein
MSAPRLRVWIYLKPHTEERLLYTSLESAQRACLVGGEIEEWHAYEESDRMQLIYRWTRSMEAGFEVDWLRGPQ